ncbi:hypothetical protein CLOSTASPAR_02092 [[Clostridium] asparagiforme DSM 15981]|uniref:Uncharacterized protein n=1 Tax=[Clostridium] asparagiforme DSM 15981 TaxID=518636 RepID=C0CYL5_9FIRM|nr:hypothetical protein CLOSTASPAR_02092 [[Clostridium] asparagiforme DSM 15981]
MREMVRRPFSSFCIPGNLPGRLRGANPLGKKNLKNLYKSWVCAAIGPVKSIAHSTLLC